MSIFQQLCYSCKTKEEKTLNSKMYISNYGICYMCKSKGQMYSYELNKTKEKSKETDLTGVKITKIESGKLKTRSNSIKDHSNTALSKINFRDLRENYHKRRQKRINKILEDIND